jgi:hypothetical protein
MEPLFSDGELSAQLHPQMDQMLSAIARAGREEVQDPAYWTDTYGAVPVVLDVGNIQTHRPEEGVVSFIVPMSGTAELLKYRPTEHSNKVPEAEVGGIEIRFTYEIQVPELDEATELKERFHADLALLQQWLVWSRTDVEKFVLELAGVTADALLNRREALDSEDELMEGLGYPEHFDETGKDSIGAPLG